MSSLAIIGSGIAGLGCAYFLRHAFDVTVFDQNAHPGGHSHTIDVSEPASGRAVSFDTGFMVFNQVTYPHLTRLFRTLDVPIKPTSMSFSVRHAASGLEFAGSSVNHLFAQRRNLVRPRFWRMLRAIDRFNREAVAALEDPTTAGERLDAYVRRRGYGADFFELYLLPMSSAVWSAPPDQMLSFPARTLLRFFHNHGFLGLHTQHPWWTVEGGSRAYVRKIVDRLAGRLRLQSPVTRVSRDAHGVELRLPDGARERFDRVILACHADQALRLLDRPSPDERAALGAFQFQPNTATVHTDERVMPRTRLAWSSWNYEINRGPGGGISTATHYWMNSLQGVSERQNFFVSINRPEAIDPRRVLRSIAYEHPLFSLEAIRAQDSIPALNAAALGRSETYFAGAWQRYGFHEDGLWSALRVCELLLPEDPWSMVVPPVAETAPR